MLTDLPTDQTALPETDTRIESPSICPGRHAVPDWHAPAGLKPLRTSRVDIPKQPDHTPMPATTTIATTLGLLAVPAVIFMFFRCHILQSEAGTASEHADW